MIDDLTILSIYMHEDAQVSFYKFLPIFFTKRNNSVACE